MTIVTFQPHLKREILPKSIKITILGVVIALTFILAWIFNYGSREIGIKETELSHD